MKKIIALLIAFVMVFSLGGCSKKQNRDTDTIYLDFEIVDNGYGYDWLESACREFEELVKNKDYDGEGGKKPGVVCKVKPVEKLTDLQTMRRSGSEVFFGGSRADTLLRTGHLLDISTLVNENNYNNGLSISDIILNSNYDTVTRNADGTYSHTRENGTSIADLIYDDAKSVNTVKNEETGVVSYYTIPTHDIYGGITYDKDLFDEYGFYFANPENTSDSYQFYCDVTKAYVNFVIPGSTENKSCGPDGKFGTYDDGMPSSLVELIQLYSYMNSPQNAVWPLQVPGQYPYESDFLTDGLYTALLGVDKARGSYDFDGSVDIVKELKTNGSAFVNESGTAYLEEFYKPDVVTVSNVTEETGYYTTWSVERYYTLLFLNICLNQGWLAPGWNPDVNTFTHQQAQYQFICSNFDNGSGEQGPRVGTMSTGSYWYNESTTSFTNFDDFYAINDEVEYRNLLWMPLPVNIFTSVTGQVGEEPTPIGTVESTKGEIQAIPQLHTNCMYFNKNVESDEVTYAALKDWVRFFHSQAQLEKNTIGQGFRKALNYEIRDLNDIENVEEREALKQLMINKRWVDFDDQGNVIWEGFYKQLSDYVEESGYVIRLDADNQTYKQNSASFKRGEYSKNVTGPKGTSYLKDLIKTAGYDAMKAFEATMITYETWAGLYRGTSAPAKLPNPSGNGFITYFSYQTTIPS